MADLYLPAGKSGIRPLMEVIMSLAAVNGGRYGRPYNIPKDGLIVAALEDEPTVSNNVRVIAHVLSCFGFRVSIMTGDVGVAGHSTN